MPRAIPAHTRSRPARHAAEACVSTRNNPITMTPEPSAARGSPQHAPARNQMPSSGSGVNASASFPDMSVSFAVGQAPDHSASARRMRVTGTRSFLLMVDG
jgi:hypothetical protein